MAAVDRAFEWIGAVEAALDSGAFIKLTLGSYQGREPELQNILGRLVEIRGVPMLSLVTRYKRKDVTKNYPLSEGVERIRATLAREFYSAHLWTAEANYQWQCDRRGKQFLKKLPPTEGGVPERSHDKRKSRVLDAALAPYLQGLGIAGADGTVKAGMADKLRQIEHFAEILSHSIQPESLAERQAFRAADMGCGKGYLAFAAYDYLRRRFSGEIAFVGVEVRPDLVSLCNRVAKECGFEGLRFVEGAIDEVPSGPLDLLVALHACDTATDDAIFAGIQAGAEWIFVAPCCHKELRPQLRPPEPISHVLRFGIFLERHAEMVTDSLRALLLEASGYRTRIFEFVSTEHTGRNIMIAAQRDGAVRREEARARFDQLKNYYGIREQRLEKRLYGA